MWTTCTVGPMSSHVNRLTDVSLYRNNVTEKMTVMIGKMNLDVVRDLYVC